MEKTSERGSPITRTVAGRSVTIAGEAVERAVQDVLPEPIHEHYVVVGGRRFPPKQVLELVTGIDRADFTTHQARRVLQRAGFSAGRSSSPQDPPPAPGRGPHGGRQAAALEPHKGRWVAQRGIDVLVAADTPQQVVAWLNRHGERGATVFRVPESPEETELLGAG